VATFLKSLFVPEKNSYVWLKSKNKNEKRAQICVLKKSLKIRIFSKKNS
jgi:hypothetical protein